MTTTTENLETDTDERTFTARETTLDVVNAIAGLYAAATNVDRPTLFEYLTKPDSKGSVQIRFLDGGQEFVSDAVAWAKETKDTTPVKFPRMTQPAWYAARKIGWLL